MPVNEHAYVVDVAKSQIVPAPNIVLGQADHNATTLIITMLDNGRPMVLDGYTAYFEMLLPGGRVSYIQEAYLCAGNTVKVTIDEEKAAAVVGSTDVAYIAVRDANDNLIASTGRFKVKVLKSARSGQPAESWISGIDAALAAMAAATDGAESAADAAESATEAAQTATAAASKAAEDVAAQVVAQAAAFAAAQSERASAFATAQADRASAYESAESDRNNDYETAEASRDEAYGRAEAVRSEQSSQAVAAATEAATQAVSAAGQARTAATTAGEAATAANTAAQGATSAATAATSAAGNASSAATAASEAATSAMEARDALEELIEEGLQVPLMTSSTRGGAKLGDGLVVADGALSSAIVFGYETVGAVELPTVTITY